MKISQTLRSLFLIGICCLLVSCHPTEIPQGTLVKVQRVLSGQTLEVLSRAGQIPLVETVRLLGIDAPDLKQTPWGPKAQDYLAQWLQDQSVLLESDGEATDGYQRRLAYIWKDQILVNEQLVKEGYVLVNTRGSNSKYEQRLADAQDWARIMGRGIWNPDEPLRQTPAEFRDQRR